MEFAEEAVRCADNIETASQEKWRSDAHRQAAIDCINDALRRMKARCAAVVENEVLDAVDINDRGGKHYNLALTDAANAIRKIS